jgi:hypothetical protein
MFLYVVGILTGFGATWFCYQKAKEEEAKIVAFGKRLDSLSARMAMHGETLARIEEAQQNLCKARLA